MARRSAPRPAKLTSQAVSAVDGSRNLLRPLLLALSALFLIGLFSPEISDPDFWWHLRTGRYIVEVHRLPVPDPFAYTTGLGSPAYSGELRTRQFNLTHEWLAQVAMYCIYRAGGFAGVVLARSLALLGFCALAGLAAYQRRRSWYAAQASAFAAAGVACIFTADRPYQITFLLLALTVALMEMRRWLWLLPPVFLIWANCHGGYFLGWVVLAAYSAEALVCGLRGKPDPNRRKLWLVSVACLLLSGINPNGFHILPVLLDYRGSFLTSKLLEWSRPRLWPPQVFSVLLLGAAIVLTWAWRRVRISDWLLFAAFAAAALSAQRNVILIGLMAPILIATYLPWRPRLPGWSEPALTLLLAVGIVAGIARGSFFQLRAAEWRYPAGAADFLLANRIQQPVFNTYEYGGYLMWRLWPQERVFIDGRALNESVFLDYARILYNHDASDGKSADELLDQYGVEVILMNTFEYTTGPVYNLAPALADPKQTTWKLVYNDPQALVFMRHPPAGIPQLNSLLVLDHMEAECGLHLEHEPKYSRCARGLGQVFAKVGDFSRARKWIGEYLSRPHDADPEAEQAYQQFVNAGH